MKKAIIWEKRMTIDHLHKHSTTCCTVRLSIFCIFQAAIVYREKLV